MSRDLHSPLPNRAPTTANSPLGELATDPLEAVNRWWHLATEFVLAHLFVSITVTMTVITLTALARSALGRWRHERLVRGAQVVQIQVPPKVEPGAAAALWANLIGLLRPRLRRWVFGQPHVAFEYCWDGPRLRLQVWVPGTIPATLIARAIEAAWPAARTSITTPAGPAPAGGVVAGGQLRLARPDHYPISTGHTADPIRGLLGAAAGIAPGQQAVVQILARPVTGRRLKGAHQAAAHLRGAAPPSLIGRVLDLLSPTAPTARPATVAAAHPERAGEVRAILDKATAPRFAVAVRYAVTTTHVTDPQAARAWTRNRAHALAAAFAVFAGRNYFDRHRLRQPCQALAGRRMGHGDLLSVPELAAIAHLPYDPAVPGLSRAGARAVPPSPAIAAGGKSTKLLGDADAGPARPIALRVVDARHHLHLLGATGAGKSTLLGNMVLSDASAGRAAVVIDPRGDLTNDLLERIPSAAAERLWLIDPDTSPPPALDVLSGTAGDANVASDSLVGIFYRIFADSWGPRTDDILRSAVLTLQQLPEATLADIPRLLTDELFRHWATHRLRDEILAGFWTWYSALSPEARANAIGPVMNKLRHVLLRPFVRQIVGTPGPGLNMRRLLDSGGILLVRVRKGTLGNDTVRLLGSFVVAQVWQTTTARARHREATRRDAALYIDEAHNFLNLPCGVEEMLAEARAYRLSVTLAHQNLTQFPSAMRDAVAANARNKIIFAISPRDARELAATTAPNLTDHDLSNLGPYQAAARLLSANTEIPAFTFTTRPFPEPVPGRADHLRHAARANAETTQQSTAPADPRLDHTTPPLTARTDADTDEAPPARPPS